MRRRSEVGDSRYGNNGNMTRWLVRTTIGARSCPRKECLDHLETGFKLTNAYPKVSVAIWVMFWQSNHELWRKNSQKRRFKVTKRRIWTQPLYEGLGLWNFLSGQRIVQICSANFGIVSIFCSYLIRAVQTCETMLQGPLILGIFACEVITWRDLPN